MKVSKIHIIIMLAFMSLASSCDFLDKEPTSTTSGSYFKSEAEAETFLKGIYAPLTETSFYGNDYFFLVGGDDLEAYGGPGRSPSTRGLICNNALQLQLSGIHSMLE